MPILKRLISQLLETIYFTIFWFILAIPASLVSMVLRNYLSSDGKATLPYLIISTAISLATLLIPPYLYAKWRAKRGGFISHKQFGFKLVNYKTKEEVSKRHYTIRMYLRILVYPIISVTIFPYFLPVFISKGKRSIFDYMLGTVWEKVVEK